MIRLENDKYYLDESVLIKKNTDSKTSNEHTHDFIELVYTIKGSCKHVIDGKQFVAHHGDMVIINYKQVHVVSLTEDSNYINILLKPEFFNESIKDSQNAFSLLTLDDFEDFRSCVNESGCLISFNKAEQKKIETLIDIALSEQADLPGSALLKKSTLNLLLIFLFRKLSLPMQEHFVGINDALLNYIKNSCEKNLTVNSVCSLCGYESTYFSRLFKKKTGLTFTAFLCKCRIEKAKSLLETTELSVEQIICESGFSDRTKFFSAFEKETGFTPLKYRKNQKK